MKLRKGRREEVATQVEVKGSKATQQKSKRQRFVEFFRPNKQLPEKQVAPPIPTLVQKPAPREPPRDSKIADSTRPAKSTTSIDDTRAGAENVEQTPLPTPPPGSKEDRKVEVLSEEYMHSLCAGAPHFSIKHTNSGSIPTVTYPWDTISTGKAVSDSMPLADLAFSAATLHRPSPDEEKYQGYSPGTLEVPSMLSAQGIEPGSIGMTHFLELPKSDSFITDLQQSQSSNGFLEIVRNKEQMQSNPTRLGIRKVDMEMIYERLIEFGDLYETFQDSPERITILNNQSPGDLYANLFSKFLTPPGYNSSTAGPTGLKVQIDSLLKVLRLKGVWYDFSLVEWRIRLGQLLWGDPDPVPEHECQPLWTERELLLLQIALSCELLLRLDAVTNMDADDAKGHLGVTPQDFESFLTLKTRKTEWDLVLARHFLDNILVVREIDVDPSTPVPKPSGLLGLLGGSQPTEQLKSDIVFLPRHQGRQLAGLLDFAETIQWPGIDLILKDLAQKLGVPDNSQEPEQPTSPYRKFLEASTPSSMSVYGTPLPTPRSALLESYFGNVGKPAVSRSNSRSLRVPLSSALLAQADNPAHVNALNIGGWLSRSYLTGLILPGEPIYHFLMSTLLENDKLAIAALGDSANLYGGFIYAQKTWWSKSSIVGRVLACMEGAVECMGWVSFPMLPTGFSDSWFAITSEQIGLGHPPRISSAEDLVSRDSRIFPGDYQAGVKSEELVLPLDLNAPPIPSISLAEWSLTPSEPEPLETDNASESYAGAENFTASLKFTSHARGTPHTFTLNHDVQFVTSWPCTPPATSLSSSLPHILKRSLTTLSRNSSKRSTHSLRERPSRHPSRRNSHGFEPLLSHPPDSEGILPLRMYSPTPDDEHSISTTPKPEPLHAHPLHITYKHKIVPATDVLDPSFILPFTMYAHASPPPSAPTSPLEEGGESNEDAATADDDTKNILVLDARASKDLELLARAWCAEKGLHALIGRVGRTCLSCCIREARGLGINVVVRV